MRPARRVRRRRRRTRTSVRSKARPSASERRGSMPAKAAEEKKLTLPPGHPQAGYGGTDPSANDDGVGTLAPVAQEWADKNQEAYEEQRDAIAEHEDKVAK